MRQETIDLKGPGVGLSGEVKYMLYDQEEDGSLTLVEERDWTSNTIFNHGLIIFTTISNPSWFTSMSIGSDGGATNPANPTLGNYLATNFNSIAPAATAGNDGSPNYTAWAIRVHRFEAGEGTGTVQEMGIGSAGGSNLYARHVVTPAIPKAANQILDVYYKIIFWPSLTPVLGTALIKGVNYDTKTSFYDVDATDGRYTQYLINNSTTDGRQYTGVEAGITDNQPSGTFVIGATPSNGAGGSGFRDVEYFCSVDQGVTTTGFIRTFIGRTNILHKFQTQFTATDGPSIGEGIPKDLTQQLTLNWQLTWARH